MTNSYIPGSRRVVKGLALGSSLMVLAACANSPGNFDWDLRGGPGSTAEVARQVTASKPVADSNGVLSYPGYQLAKARRGETVAAMAGRLGLNGEELARNNALRPTDPLREGEMLLLPSRVAAVPQPVMGSTVATAPAGSRPVDITSIATTALDSVPALAPTAAPSASTPGGGKEPIRHKVVRGETAFVIARSYNVSAKSLAEWNNLGADMGIREGQTLIIPVATGAPPPAATSVVTNPGSGSPTPAPPSASKPLPDEKTQPAAEKPKNTPASPDLGAGSKATKLAMPVSGKIIRAYDKKKNQGIDIAAPAGTPVKAAEAGTVAAVTKDTEQVTIVVIRHADNLLTVYAGIDGLKVKKGDKVSRGQTLGGVRAANPAFLHFEVRKGVDSLNPMSFLQ
ncbi:peptidoglycan DD-metalloendopeptidase family protein [Xinfangfangia sp. CPCC 101601]|uniref:Peptidoglycan DD-metalloendopeptidase family protein n=1 Tax=Pseudogemmobacter lacusdianii TaxID=3069608 RepID=A0ABU0VY02_9RHOB|nr:peptidoglycan DD-metalloendopeptidase family protein [Xinfangfangia sp. CPCC 101601]MDQ2066639.1 peptidoglycan DD-metalloendopeptidase family protein [Xinfangfangia sp. CPCC 101601]